MFIKNPAKIEEKMAKQTFANQWSHSSIHCKVDGAIPYIILHMYKIIVILRWKQALSCDKWLYNMIILRNLTIHIVKQNLEAYYIQGL